MGDSSPSSSKGNEAAEEEVAKWNDDGAAEEAAGEITVWTHEPMLLAGTALVLLVDVLSIVAILTVVEENDRASGT